MSQILVDPVPMTVDFVMEFEFEFKKFHTH